MSLFDLLVLAGVPALMIWLAADQVTSAIKQMRSEQAEHFAKIGDQLTAIKASRADTRGVEAHLEVLTGITTPEARRRSLDRMNAGYAKATKEWEAAGRPDDEEDDVA